MPTKQRPKAFLIGDIKLSLAGIWDKDGPERQLVIMTKYATYPAGNMVAPVVLYVSLKGANARDARSIDRFGKTHGVLIFSAHVF